LIEELKSKYDEVAGAFSQYLREAEENK